MPRSFRTILLGGALVIAAFPYAAYAFTGDFLISDFDFTDTTAMSLADVQRFLQARSSPLAYQFLPDSAGSLKLPAEIIWFAAQEARMNPRVLLTTLQKEQRLITASSPTPRQVDFAMGYGCPDGSGCSDRFRGFGKQVRGAAFQFRGYLDDLATKGETIARWAVGRAQRTGDAYEITPRNAATAALYSYTPWRGGSSNVGGNFSFARIFRQWFLGGAWPDGTVLEAPDGVRWLLQGGKRRRFTTPAVFAARPATSSVIVASGEEIEAYEEGAPLRFSEYAVVQSPDGVRWLLVGDTKRKFATAEVFRRLGFNPEEIEIASSDDLTAYRDGAAITLATGDPRGTLVRERETRKLYALVGKEKFPILDPALAALHFDGATPMAKSSRELSALKTGKPLTFPDGILVAAPKYLPAVFFISRGQRRPFASARALELLGYSWSDIRHVTNAALELHALGSPIEDLNDSVVEIVRPTAPTTIPAAPAYNVPFMTGLSIF